MTSLTAAMSRINKANRATAPQQFPENRFRKLEPWPDIKAITVKSLRPFARFDVIPTETQLAKTMATMLRRGVGLVVVNDDSEVLFGQLRVAALQKYRGPRSRVYAVKFPKLNKEQLAFLIRQAFSPVYSDGWDRQMMSIDCQALNALVSKTGVTAPKHARRRVVAHH